MRRSLTQETLITPCKDDKLRHIPDPDIARPLYETVMVPKIKSIQEASRIKEFPNCGRRIIQATASEMFKCDYCNHRIRASSCKSHLMVNLVVTDELNLTISEDVLATIMEKDVQQKEEEVCHKLIMMSDVTFRYNRKRKVDKEVLLPRTTFI